MNNESYIPAVTELEKAIDQLLIKYRAAKPKKDTNGVESLPNLALKLSAEQMAQGIWDELLKLPRESTDTLFLWCKLHCAMLGGIQFDKASATEDFIALRNTDADRYVEAQKLYRSVFSEFWVIWRPLEEGGAIIPTGINAYLDEVW